VNIEKKREKTLRVLLVCGSGIVSSELAAPRVEDILSELTHNNYILYKGTIYDIPKYSSEGRIDVALSTAPVNSDLLSQIKVPVVIITALLMGKKEKVVEELKKILNKE
jgi:galactitol-specific phosphotransferase system IIB component